MPANTLPSGIHDLLFLAEHIQAGLETHGPWLHLGDPARFAADHATLRAAEGHFAVARATQAEAAQRFAAVDEKLTAWLARARLVVMLALGSAWSGQWLEAGFSHRRTNVPKRLAPRLELGRRLAAFFAGHPGWAVPFAGVTAETARALCAEIRDAELAVQTARVAAAQCKQVRDAAEKRLRWQMRSVVLKLSASLEKGDARWRAFGLRIPRPGTPAHPRWATRGTGTPEIAHLPALPPTAVPAAQAVA